MRHKGLNLHQAVLVTALLLPFSGAGALDIDTAVEQALERDAGLKALARRQAAAAETAIADSALPDPEIVIGAQGLPVDDPLGSDTMTMYVLGLRQRIPPGRSLELAGERRRSDGAALGLDYRARRLEILREVRLAWIDWVISARVLALAEDGLEAIDSLLELTRARYRSGSGRQRDVDQARLERGLMSRRVLDSRRDLDRAASQLARWTGSLPPERPPTALPDWPGPAAPDPGRERLREHPVIRADGQRLESGRIGTDLARQAYRPRWTIEAGYAHQPGSRPLGGRMSDKLFGMVSVSLPLFAANRQDRRVAAAEAEVDALAHQRELRLQEWEGRARNLATEIRSQQQRLELIERDILPEARRTLESTLQAYRSDRASFDELVRARLGELDQQLEAIETRGALLAAQAELAYLTAEDLP
ncbi:MAG: TolC family protein [Gammaproteobacteria bacterium]|jgi:outer membrane protein TolC|nr:TolC family protein [Gammaproteobacteria bacterium]